MSPQHRIITLLTDFGLSDPYVAMMKGAVLTINPRAVIIDISHYVQAQNIIQGAFMLYHSYHYFPKKTIHVAVVDPGVGTSRRAILLVTRDAYFIAPDNGILSYVVGSRARKKAGFQKLSSGLKAYSLNNRTFWRKVVSRTFHGRDIFAPVAAHLHAGVKPEEMGERIDSLLVLPLPRLIRVSPREIRGEVVYIDHFGNLVTNILADELTSNSIIKIAEKEVKGLTSYYAAAENLLAIIGSLSCLEIAFNGGNAAQFLEIKPREKVAVCMTKNSEDVILSVLGEGQS